MSVVIDRRLSFSGGEFSPWTEPRLDLDKYRHACRRLRNMRPMVYGGAFSRPGSVFIGYQRSEDAFARLVPFEFSVTSTVVLEFGSGYIRFWTTGPNPGPIVADVPLSAGWATAEDYPAGYFFRHLGQIYYVRQNHTSTSIAADLAAGKISLQTEYEVPSPYGETDLDALQFAQLNDLVYVAHPSFPPMQLSRLELNKWTFSPLDIEWPATLGVNRKPITIDPSGVTGNITLMASEEIFDVGHTGSRWVIRNRREEPSVDFNMKTESAGYTTGPLYVLGQWTASIRAAVTGGEYKSVVLVERSYDKSTWETVATISSTRASVQAIIPGTELEPCWLRLRYLTKDNPSSLPNGLTAELVASDPNHYGLVEITGYTSPQVVTARVLFELGTGAATEDWEEAAWSGFRGWPRAITIHEDRLYFAGTNYQPQTVWASVIDDFGNFRLSSDADGALQLKASSDRANGIQWLISADSLLMGTTGSEWVYGSRDQSGSITPAGTAVRRSTSYGSAHIQPVMAQESTLFVQRTGLKVREFTYTFEQDGYVAQDLTLLSNHITQDGIRQITVQRQPETVLWCVTKSGDLAGLVYERGQGVAGWFLYDTAGTIESVACIPGAGEEDEVWISVRRVIDGVPRRMVERFQPDQYRALRDGENKRLIYVDCAKMVQLPEPGTEVTGLDHLEGMDVSILADGAPEGTATVLGGKITLDYEASVIVVGLPYVPELQPTWLETNDPGSLTKSSLKRCTRMHVEYWKSLGTEYRENARADWSQVEFRTDNDRWDEVSPLFTGILELDIEADYERQTTILLRQVQPLPFNILSLQIHYDVSQQP